MDLIIKYVGGKDVYVGNDVYVGKDVLGAKLCSLKNVQATKRNALMRQIATDSDRCKHEAGVAPHCTLLKSWKR
jgi:hypothetical protein